MRQRVRLKVGGGSLLAMAATAALLVMPASGSAADPVSTVSAWNPQNTNVPYLAWAGEEIRLEKCIPVADAQGVDPSTVQANFLVEDWSSSSADIQKRAQIEPSTVKIFVNSASGQVCAQGDAVSLYPGMARIELDIVGDVGRLGYDPASPLLKHQFLAGWMTLNTPSLKEMAATDFVSTAQAEAAKELGDPTGNGAFTAGGNNGYLDVKVTGSMPTDAWTGLGLPASVTLPNDWPTLAKALATDQDPTDTTPWTKWDTSGDSTGLEGHVIQSPPCAAEPASEAGVPTVPLGNDNGDNCTGGGADGGFSTVFGTLSPAGSTIGPFDPVDSADTLLSDGSLNSQDAPMPAARIDVSIAPNSGAASDISGVGSLEAADKTKTASRDFLGDSSAHNLYSPFYDAYIPATARGDVSSGIDGAYGNNFPGFLDVTGLYHFWDIAHSLASNTGSATSCLHRSYDPQSDSPTAHPGDYYQTPSGDSSVAVYTDQNGEAQVQYDPGTGFYFDSLAHNGAAILNANGGCDLQNVGTLGTSSISATARYPFKPVSFPAMTSAPVAKSVTSLWSKTLAYFPKGPGAANSVSRIVVAHAQDIDGTPFAHEVVCFSADKNAEAVYRFNGTVAGINLNGVGSASDPKKGGRACVTTDANGNAAVEVLNSDPTAVNVIADFTREGILRNISVDYATPGSSGGTPPPPTGTTTPVAPTGGSNSGTTAPSVSLIKAVAPNLLGSIKAKTIKTHITLARFVSPAHGRHYALINVKSSSSTVKVRLRLLVKSHGKTHTVVRVITVHTNRQVKIALDSSVKKVLGVSLVK